MDRTNSGVARVIVLGGGGQNASAEGTSHSRGKILKSRVPQMRFPAFSGEILQKKILLLRITHSPRPSSISPRTSSFHRGGPLPPDFLYRYRFFIQHCDTRDYLNATPHCGISHVYKSMLTAASRKDSVIHNSYKCQYFYKTYKLGKAIIMYHF